MENFDDFYSLPVKPHLPMVTPEKTALSAGINGNVFSGVYDCIKGSVASSYRTSETVAEKCFSSNADIAKAGCSGKTPEELAADLAIKKYAIDSNERIANNAIMSSWVNFGLACLTTIGACGTTYVIVKKIGGGKS